MRTWNTIELSDGISFGYLRGHPIIEMTVKGWNDAEYLSDMDVLVSIYAIQYEYINKTCFKVYYHYDFLLLNVTVLRLVEIAKQRIMEYIDDYLTVN